jgi:hypothetical protein
VNGPENSQQISDWYTPSHFIHGILFFAFFTWLLRTIAPTFLSRRTAPSSLSLAFLLSVILESAWEILENSPIIINRYREATLAVGYMGDSVLNSVCDIVFMSLGFLFAQRVPVWVSVVLVIFLELFVGYMIRDNLTFNIIMLLYPIDAIRIWQGGA